MRIPLQPIDAIDILVPLVGGANDNFIVSVCIDRQNLVGLSECFQWPIDAPEGPDIDSLFELPIREGALGAMFVSRTFEPIEVLHENDIEFTRSIVEHGRAVRVAVVEHVLVHGDSFRLMSESIGPWPVPDPGI